MRCRLTSWPGNYHPLQLTGRGTSAGFNATYFSSCASRRLRHCQLAALFNAGLHVGFRLRDYMRHSGLAPFIDNLKMACAVLMTICAPICVCMCIYATPECILLATISAHMRLCAYLHSSRQRTPHSGKIYSAQKLTPTSQRHRMPLHNSGLRSGTTVCGVSVPTWNST